MKNDTKYKIQNTRYMIQNTKYKIQNTKYKIQDTRYTKAFTLIEVLIYTALSAVVGTLMVGILLTITQVNLRESASTEVTSQLNFVTQTFGRLVRTASNIEIAAGVSTSTIKLRMQDSAKDPTCLSLVNGVIKLAEGPGTNPNDCNTVTSDLTNTRVIVNTLNFKKFTQYPGHDTVSYDVQMTYNSQNPKAQVQRSLSSAIARVSAATFDSNILPGSSSYEIGQTGSPWSKTYLNDGTAASPSYTFGNDTGLGIFKVSGTSTIGFSTQGLERMRINSTGNVGIGTTAPGVPLEVYGNQNGATFINIHNPNGGISASAVLNFQNPVSLYGGQLFLNPNNAGASYGGSNTFNMYNFLNAPITFGTNSSERMRIDAAGNVGIGTTGPGDLLHMASGATGGTVLRIQNTSAGGTTAAINSTGSGSASGAGDISIEAPIGTTRMLIQSADGNVGIGTTTPNEKLEVNGNVKMGYEIVNASYTVGSGSVSCSAGKQVIGGGCQIFQGGGAYMAYSYPNTVTSWQCNANITANITVYAICANIR